MRGIGTIIGERRSGTAQQRLEAMARGRSVSLHRLQVGASGLVGIVLMLALADVITDRANRTEAGSVPEAAATVSPGPTVHSQQNDPLAEAGVVPGPKATPAPAPAASPTLPPIAGQDDALEAQ
ncbi:hypothetical protein V5F89_06955 [Pelagerythrobacter marensis]|uniref:Uncharacterized protein n=1 Tax=Pelagerythrobacter marensis TaxID=543877 RepID=A0ABZ2D106_9SPHN